MKKTQVPLVLMVDYSIYISSRGIRLVAGTVRGGRGQHMLQTQEQGGGSRLAANHKQTQEKGDGRKTEDKDLTFYWEELQNQLCECDAWLCLVHLLPFLSSTNEPNPIIFVHGVPSKEL